MNTDSSQADRPLPVGPIELVAVDVDGTLLRSNGDVCPESAETISAATRKGVRVVLASARAPRGLKAIHRMLGLQTLLISHNGALIFDGDPQCEIFHQPMHPPVARQVIDLAVGIDPSVKTGIEVSDTCYTNTADHRIRAHAVAGPMAKRMRTLEPYLSTPVTKIFFLGEPSSLGAMHAAIRQRLSFEVTFVFSQMNLLQVVHASVNKGTALAKVAQQYGVPRERVMAIGDAPNDVSMLQWAGLGAAVQNSWADVRQAAHFIVPSNDQAGVAHALRKYALRG